MSVLKFKKVNSLPGVLEANTIYIIKENSNHVLHITDKDGITAYKSYDSVTIASVSSAYIDSLLGQPNGIAGLDLDGFLENKIKITDVLLDFGTIPVYSKKFEIINPLVTTSSKIIMTASANPAPGKSSDELEMDNFLAACVCEVDGIINAYIKAEPGPVKGPYRFNYFLG
jgi:hypothetical protein